MNERYLEGRTALVTGAGRGLGRAISRRLARLGAEVILADIDQAALTESAHLISEEGGRPSTRIFDVSNAEEVRAVFAGLPQLHILVNNAGICPFAEFLDITEELWDRVLDTNLKGYFLCSQAVARVMIEKGVKGRIIAVSSISSEFGGRQQAHYCASKAGINLLIKSMAIALGPYGITCNAVLPGTVETDINRHVLAQPEVRAYWEKRAPLGGIGRPEDIAGPVLFFASDDASWCTGSMLVVDGGTSVFLQ